MLVDLEKARYGAAGFDLAHATLYTSTTWDIAVNAVLETAEMAAAYSHWLDSVPHRWPMRRAPGCCRYGESCVAVVGDVVRQVAVQSRAAAKNAKHIADNTEDWSADLSDQALVDHVADRVADYLDAGTIAAIRSEWLGANALTALLPPHG